MTYLFALDTEQYTKAIEADPYYLLQMIDKREYIFIERVMRSGCCSTHRLVEDAIVWMFENNIDPNDENSIANFVEGQPFCKLLYYLIKYEFVEIGNSIQKHSKVNVEEPKYYENYAVPALVYKCNLGRKKTLRSQLASSILLKLVTKRAGSSRTLSSYEAIMDAGASLQFVRYHLNAPEKLFHKAGRFNCTAQELHDNGFDLLFCLRADFDTDELIVAGFDIDMVNNKAVLERDENGECFKEREHLKRLKESGFIHFFKLNFSPDDLLSTNVFLPVDLIDYHHGAINTKQSVKFSFFGGDLPLRRSDGGYRT